jgi:hypothetical protein
MRPVCVACQIEMRCEKNGVGIVEMIHVDGGSAEPYRLWSADRWRCPGCGQQMVVGYGREPMAEQYQPDFMARIAEVGGNVLLVYERLSDVPECVK